MNQLVNNNHFDFSNHKGISPIEQKIIRSSMSAPILNPDAEDFGKKELVRVLKTSIQEAILVIGQKQFSSEDIITTSLEVAGYIFDNLSRVRLDEVKIAIKQGSFGDYKAENDIVYMSAKNVISWLKSYLSEKHKAIKKFQDQNTKMTEEIRAKEDSIKAQAKFIEDLPDLIEQDRILYHENGFSQWISWLYYDKLDKLDIINISPEDKHKFYKEATIISQNEFREKKGYLKFVQNQSIETSAVNIAKRMCIEQWYSTQNNDVSEEIREKLKEN